MEFFDEPPYLYDIDVNNIITALFQSWSLRLSGLVTGEVLYFKPPTDGGSWRPTIQHPSILTHGIQCLSGGIQIYILPVTSQTSHLCTHLSVFAFNVVMLIGIWFSNTKGTKGGTMHAMLDHLNHLKLTLSLGVRRSIGQATGKATYELILQLSDYRESESSQKTWLLLNQLKLKCC